MSVVSSAAGRLSLVAMMALSAGSVSPVAAQATRQVASSAPTAASVATIIVAHGGDSIWNSHVFDVARQAKTGGPVEVSFLMGPAAAQTRFQDVVAKLEKGGASRIVVIPMLVSSHSGHYDQIRYLAGENVKLDETMEHHLHMSGIAKPTTRVPMVITKAIDSSPELADVLTDRAKAMTNAPREHALMIVGHGPNDAEEYAHWMRHLRIVADSVKARTGYRDVRLEMVRDDAPPHVRAEAVIRVRELIDMQSQITGRDVMVIPVLLSRGSVSRSKVAADIAGTKSKYVAETILPHPAMARWVESRVREASAASTSASKAASSN
ncbi:MAG: hypothetical protein IBJ03_17090 [Gemmatimonadaceae bacterium]|nr:hypothetical protein [Gemmatimonadaceae bacterium]